MKAFCEVNLQYVKNNYMTDYFPKNADTIIDAHII